MKIGANLKLFRLKANLTRKDVAKELDITEKTLGHYETDYTQPKFEDLDKLCKLYRVSISALFEEKFNDDKELLRQEKANDDKELLRQVINLLRENGTLNETAKSFEDLDPGSQQMILGALNKFIADSTKKNTTT
jgi:transcriptional regulator with XRE-family HTH domain